MKLWKGLEEPPWQADETTEESGGTMSVVEGTTEVPEPDKTITGIDKTTMEALLKSTLETEQTTLRTKETTEPQETPSYYKKISEPNQSTSNQTTKNCDHQCLY